MIRQFLIVLSVSLWAYGQAIDSCWGEDGRHLQLFHEIFATPL